MKVSMALDDREAPEFLERFVGIIGAEALEKRYRILTRQAQESPTLRDFIVRRHGIELTVGHTWNRAPRERLCRST
jgi:hypothetical protein